MFKLFPEFIVQTFLLQENFNIKADITAVANSIIGNVHHTRVMTFSDNVKRYATGRTNRHNLKNEISSGKSAQRKACSIPCTATLNAIKQMGFEPTLKVLEFDFQLFLQNFFVDLEKKCYIMKLVIGGN